MRENRKHGLMREGRVKPALYSTLFPMTTAKELRVKDVVFAKKRGLAVLDMAKSTWVYKKLRNFRAGIEANISTLKRAFGLDRCTWKGWDGFKRYVWSSIFAYNLQVIARIKLEAA